MKIKRIASEENFIMPKKGKEGDAGWDIYMPSAGTATGYPQLIPLGFSLAIPKGWVALLLPRSGTGAKYGLELNNTCGIIDSNYRGEWKACLRTKGGDVCSWNQGDRLLQFVIVQHLDEELELVEELDETNRGSTGFGDSGK